MATVVVASHSNCTDVDPDFCTVHFAVSNILAI